MFMGAVDGSARHERLTGAVDSRAVTAQYPNEAHEIAVIIERLEQQFPDVPPQHVAEIILAAHRELDGRPIRIYVPVLVERGARQRLRKLSGRSS